MSAVEYRPDHAGIAAYLVSSEVRELVLARAEMGAEFARRIAPVDSGDYQESIHVEDGGLGGRRRDRPMALIVASAPHSAALEFGNGRVPALHTLARAADIVEAG